MWAPPATFSCEGSGHSGFGVWTVQVPITRTHLCHCDLKAAVDNRQTSKHDCVPIKLYLKMGSGTRRRIWPMGSSLLTLTCNGDRVLTDVTANPSVSVPMSVNRLLRSFPKCAHSHKMLLVGTWLCAPACRARRWALERPRSVTCVHIVCTLCVCTRMQGIHNTIQCVCTCVICTEHCAHVCTHTHVYVMCACGAHAVLQCITHTAHGCVYIYSTHTQHLTHTHTGYIRHLYDLSTLLRVLHT